MFHSKQTVEIVYCFNIIVVAWSSLCICVNNEALSYVLYDCMTVDCSNIIKMRNSLSVCSWLTKKCTGPIQLKIFLQRLLIYDIEIAQELNRDHRPNAFGNFFAVSRWQSFIWRHTYSFIIHIKLRKQSYGMLLVQRAVINVHTHKVVHPTPVKSLPFILSPHPLPS